VTRRPALSLARAAAVGRRIARPPARWSVLALCLAVLLVLLFVQGVSVHAIGASGTPAPGRGAPQAAAGSLLTSSDGRLAAARPVAPRRVALTFDDGPDPTWTPRIAAELRRLHAPATFFVVGSEVVRHPAIVRRLYAQGFELGNHTFTHADLAAVPRWRVSLEIGATDNAIAGAVGVHPRLLRLPYSATPETVTAGEVPGLRRLAETGRVLTLADADGRDWQPGRTPRAIIRSAVPAGR
jgi:peptidoglycan/xylan/chitin deacetylase (PgdA/CDA1 family)